MNLVRGLTKPLIRPLMGCQLFSEVRSVRSVRGERQRERDREGEVREIESEAGRVKEVGGERDGEKRRIARRRDMEREGERVLMSGE